MEVAGLIGCEAALRKRALDFLWQKVAEEEAAELTARIIDGSKLTQAEIAHRMHVSQPYIAQLKKGRHPTLPTLFRLARACGVQLRVSAASL